MSFRVYIGYRIRDQINYDYAPWTTDYVVRENSEKLKSKIKEN